MLLCAVTTLLLLVLLLHETDDFAEVSKNLFKYRSENNYV